MGLKAGLNLLQKAGTAATKYADDAARLVATKGDDVVGVFCRKAKPIKPTNLKGLRFTPETVGDTFTSNIPKYNSKIAPLRKHNYGWGGIARLENGDIIGEFKCGIRSNTLKCDATRYPASWIDSKTGLARDSLHVDYMDTRYAEHQGYGREMMKRFYLQSVESGCGGRISLESAWGSGGFYKKLGFEVGQNDLNFEKQMVEQAEKFLDRLTKRKASGESIPDSWFDHAQSELQRCRANLADPIRTGQGSQALFFTPTPENLAKLFSK